MSNIKVKLADLTIEVEANFSETEEFFRDYIVEDVLPDMTVSPSMEDVEAERRTTADLHISGQYLETLAIQRQISNRLPYFGRLLMHGAVIAYEGKGYMFTARSGTGKSTHISLWKSHMGDAVEIINGDKPFLWVKEDEVRIYGTPWAGKEGWQKNTGVPLCGICFLMRGKVNRIRRIRPEDGLQRSLCQLYMPKEPETMGKTLELLDRLLQTVPLYLLECDMTEEAVKTSFEAMTGAKYKHEL